MSENNSVIQFLGYRVTEIAYICAPDFEFPKENVAYKFNFSKSLVSLSDNEIQEILKINVFYAENDDFESAPYKLSIEMAGRFSSASEWQPQWESNALAIMFPYLRTLVSMLTSSSGREPIILPTVNIISMFKSPQ